jgi:hypothetical protein
LLFGRRTVTTSTGHVAGSTTPFTGSPWASWKSRTAASVSGPEIPSTVNAAACRKVCPIGQPFRQVNGRHNHLFARCI